MMPRWIETKQLAVQHERYPGERVPGTTYPRSKCPADAFPVKPIRHMKVVRNILTVIETDEPISAHRQEHENRQGEQTQRYQTDLQDGIGCMLWLAASALGGRLR